MNDTLRFFLIFATVYGINFLTDGWQTIIIAFLMLLIMYLNDLRSTKTNGATNETK